MLGMFGGTFDPVHLGHLQPVEQAARQLGIERIHLIPCHIPPHRQSPSVSSQHRLEMVKLASQDNPLFIADNRELICNKPSYSFNTINQFRQQFPTQSLCFFMGMDAFNHFDQWYRWQDILSLCHLIICSRPNYKLSDKQQITQLVQRHDCQDSNELHRQQNGLIYFAEVPLTDVSATEIREQLSQAQYFHPLLPQAVTHYIKQHHLYIRGV